MPARPGRQFSRGSSRYAKNPLKLLLLQLRRPLAQAQKACIREPVLHNAQGPPRPRRAEPLLADPGRSGQRPAGEHPGQVPAVVGRRAQVVRGIRPLVGVRPGGGQGLA